MPKILGDISNGRVVPYFTSQQMIEIYEATGRSADIETICAKASELYPHIVDSEGIPLWKLPPHGRWFDCGNNTYGPPAFVLVSNKCNAVGIMEDGTPRPF